MLKGIGKVVESKNIYNFVALIEIFMQDRFVEEKTKEVLLSTFIGAIMHTLEHIREHLQST
jgi:hypothetical protein